MLTISDCTIKFCIFISSSSQADSKTKETCNKIWSYTGHVFNLSLIMHPSGVH